MSLDPYLSACEVADAIRTRAVSPMEVVAACLERIERLEPRLNAFCHVADAEARRAALALADELAAGTSPDRPFLGAPIAIKDQRAVRGWPLCEASEGTAHHVADADAPAVRALREAGFIFVGATTSPEFGTTSVTESARHGVTCNPWDPERSPGGSSGGAAAAVAAGILPIAHGSDGAGSIREPASYCGLVGLKPSRARVPATVHALEGFVSDGVLTRTVEDSAAALDVFAAAPRRSWYVAPAPERPYRIAATTTPPRLRVGLNLQPAFPTPVDRAAEHVARQAADLLAELGHDVRETAIPGLDPEWFRDAFDVVYMTGSAGSAITAEDRLEPLNRLMRRRARETDSLTYVETVHALQRRSAELLGAWDELDLVLTPSNPVPTFRTGTLWDGQDEDWLAPLRRSEQTAAFTVLANVLGLPAISLPLFEQPDGMPLGAQLVGRPWDDATVLAVAGELERARPWRDRRPRICA